METKAAEKNRIKLIAHMRAIMVESSREIYYARNYVTLSAHLGQDEEILQAYMPHRIVKTARKL